MKIKISNRTLEGICKGDIVSGLLLWAEGIFARKW
jgi:hypothetical protein